MGDASAVHVARPAARGREERELATFSPKSSRRRALRSRSIRVARASRDERERAARRSQELEETLQRPHRRAECVDGPRPCPYVACRHHLYLDVSPATGTIKLNFPDLEVWQLAESCALDVAEAGAQPLERASLLLNVTRERIRQIEAVAMGKLAVARDVQRLRTDF